MSEAQKVSLPADLQTAEADLLNALKAALASGKGSRWGATLRFANFAHGEIMSFGAMITILFTWFFQSQNIGLGILPTALLALPIGIIATIILCIISDKFVFQYFLA